MTQRICCRCQNVLHVEDEGTLVFCWHCGAPQVVLSEELREQAEQQAATYNAISSGAAQAVPAADPTAVDWKTIIRLSAGVALFFSFLSLAMPPLVLLVPAIVLGLYTARFQQTRVSGALGARLGLLCGLFTAIGVTSLLTLGLLIARFGTGQMAQFDATMNARLMLMKSDAIASHDPMQVSFVNNLFIPEFLATMGVLGMAMYAALIAAFSTASGAFAGYIRSRGRTR